MASVSVSPFVSVEEYLRTVYETDVDYVDGILEDRNVGEMDHSMVQRMLLLALVRFEEVLDVVAVIETRTQTQRTRYRVPDVAIVRLHNASEQIIRTPPRLCVEVMSPEDRLPRLRKKCEDYLAMGVPAVWIFDTPKQTAYEMTIDGLIEVRDGSLQLASPPIEADVQGIYAAAAKRTGRAQ